MENIKLIKELRVGNILEYNHQEFNVCRIFNDIVENEFWSKPISELRGIPITEELLVIYGFESCESKYHDSPDILTYQISNNETLDYEDERFFIASIGSHEVFTFWYEIKYLHTLQNVIYFLSGEELKQA